MKFIETCPVNFSLKNNGWQLPIINTKSYTVGISREQENQGICLQIIQCSDHISLQRFSLSFMVDCLCNHMVMGMKSSLQLVSQGHPNMRQVTKSQQSLLVFVAIIKNITVWGNVNHTVI